MSVSTPDRLISEELQNIAKELNKRLEDVAGEKMGFSLVVFNAVAGSRMNYASNCDRREVYSALMSLLSGWEKGMPDIKAHEMDG